MTTYPSESQSMPDLDATVNQIRAVIPDRSARVVLVTGNFNVLHPGHLRLFNFAAECGDYLVVGINPDTTTGVIVPEHLRLESLQGISVVDCAFVMRWPVEELINVLRPSVVVKGSEHEHHINAEQPALEAYGGKLLFSSGEVRFSSLDLLQRELHEVNLLSIAKPRDYIARHKLAVPRLIEIVKAFSSLRVIVVGDLIVDEYVTCDPLGMSQEDPTIVVTPIKRDLFVGGAGIVAGHASGLGADVSFFSVVGDDRTAEWARQALDECAVRAHLVPDNSRPTTLKQRYRAQGKTLLRVSHLRQHVISKELADRLLTSISSAIDDADVLVFSDFNYGCLPQGMVDSIIAHCRAKDVLMVADSQASSQVSDISRFHGMKLLTPTEHEARLATRDMSSGLVTLAETLVALAQAGHVLITLGAEGVFIHSPATPSEGLITDQLPAFNQAPKDVSGAGDSLLTSAAMALAVGASIWEAAFIGSLAAACQVGRIGNLPLSAEEILKEIRL
jgi:rfaE bifunctional protein kinase chain/domain